MAENSNISLTVDAWADIVINEWLKKIEALNIGNTTFLRESLFFHIHNATGGDPGRIDFLFEWYGKMVDYGVGKGVSLADRDGMIAAGLTKRKPKPWFTDTFYKEVAVLRHLLAEKYGLKAQLLIVRNLQDNADYYQTEKY